MKISKRFFSGFCFSNEQELFSEYLIQNDFTVSGFSFGAIKAFEEVYASNERVDRLQLFSPAFFQIQDEKFKRMQLMYFKKDAKAYCETFLKNTVFPNKNLDIEKYFSLGTAEQLDELLNYVWDKDKLQELVNRGVKIEVYLGEKDKIVDSLKSKEFFINYSTTYYIKNKGHIL